MSWKKNVILLAFVFVMGIFIGRLDYFGEKVDKTEVDIREYVEPEVRSLMEARTLMEQVEHSWNSGEETNPGWIVSSLEQIPSKLDKATEDTWNFYKEYLPKSFGYKADYHHRKTSEALDQKKFIDAAYYYEQGIEAKEHYNNLKAERGEGFEELSKYCSPLQERFKLEYANLGLLEQNNLRNVFERVLPGEVLDKVSQTLQAVLKIPVPGCNGS